jgi:hypothetical protein
VPKFKCRNNGGYYIHTSGDDNPVNTYQLTDRGAEIIKSSGRELGEFFPDSLFFLLYDLGHLSTKGDNVRTSDELGEINSLENGFKELSAEDRANVLAQVVEKHGVEELYTGITAKWVQSLIGEGYDVTGQLIIEIVQASGYRLSTMLEYSNSVHDGKHILEIGLCGHLQLRWLRESASFDGEDVDETERSILGVNEDFAYIDAPNEGEFLAIPGPIDDIDVAEHVDEDLKSELGHVWGTGIGTAGFAALTTMEVRSEYDVKGGIALPKSRLTDFPVDSSTRPEKKEIPPNELTDLYEGFFTVKESLPEDTNLLWQYAIESILFDEEGLANETSYGEQQAETNDFDILTYRTQYGDGDRVTEFPAITTDPPAKQDQQFVDEDTQLPVSPESKQVVPINPDPEALSDAFSILNEFPSEPGEEAKRGTSENLLNPDQFPGIQSPSAESVTTRSSKTESVQEVNDTTDRTATDSEEDPPSTSTPLSEEEHASPESQNERERNQDSQSERASASDKTIIRQDGPGEQTTGNKQVSNLPSTLSVKYDDPQAERAHRRAQQRDPSNVVGLGEEIQLVLQEVDYSGQQTIMGSKNGLVIFVNEAPQGLSKHDCIRVKIIDYGGNNNSAQAAFVGYNE